ncbi:hypothetical protein DB347_15320 [Opitutaceae bacterium EW11]|nr:hypothetical protein DB347_15320 [Opitutaceae bacterium EW11]
MLSAPLPCRAGFFSSVWGDVVVTTDTTDAGRKVVHPTPQKPVYYRGISLGCKFGSIPGDEMPDVHEMDRYVGKVLAKEGYLPAKPGSHDPTLFLVLQWGYLRPGSDDLYWFLGYDPAQDIAAPVMPGKLGPEVFRRGMRSRMTETILESASGPIYGIIVSAFEYSSANSSAPVIYWQTRIGIPANGKSMAEALPVIALAAGPNIGREMKTPALVSADDVRKGDVKLGELQVIDYYEEPSPSK